MDKSKASSQSQKSSAKPRVSKISSTPRPEFLTPPATKSMVSLVTATSQPLETSGGNVYLRVIEDAMARFSPSEKMSEIFTQLANKFREKEEAPATKSVGPSADPVTPIVSSIAQPLQEPMTISETLRSGNTATQDQIQEEGREGENGAEWNSRGEQAKGEGSNEAKDPEEKFLPESVGGKRTKESKEVVNVEAEESEDYE